VEFFLFVIADGQLSYHSLPGTTVRIGCSSHCEVKIDHPSISSLHAVLRTGLCCTIEDRGSANGVRIKSRALVPMEPVEIAIGDMIELGSVLIMVQHRLGPSTSAVKRLPSRPHGYFAERLDEACARAQRSEQKPAIVLVRATHAEDSHAVYELMSELASADGCIGLLGPADVELLVPDVATTNIADLVAQMRAAATARGLLARFAAACFPRDGRDAASLVASASDAMHASARNRFDDAHVPRGALQPDPAVIERVAAGTISVLILGETGVGKEILAERIHRSSPRADRPLVRLNCVALSEALLESELFGYEKGAFTGAVSAKPGLIEVGEGGTVFLDEIGELPMTMQVKLLRVLESREILPVGGVRPRAVDVRFISATNVDLEAEIARGGFRADLYYRLNGVTLYVRPLRQRAREIAGLAEVFIAHACRGLGRTRYPVLSAEALHLLESCRWPGNIRELRNVIERAVLFCTTDTIRPEQLSIEKSNPPAQLPESPGAGSDEIEAGPGGSERAESVAMTVQRELEMLEKQRILQALQTCAGNQSRAAKLLAIPRRTLLKRLDTYRIPRPRKRGSSVQRDADAEPAKAWPSTADEAPTSSEPTAAPCDAPTSPAGATAIGRGRA
jgi:two-component system, NtrC family, response regulator AtoC